MQTQVEIKYSPKDVVAMLRERANKSVAFNAMVHVFALRERTRQQITLANLFQVMLREGFRHTKLEYAKELEFMAALGIGKLEHDSKGRLRALKGIQVTLQSIGLAAAAKKDSLDRVTLIPTFTSLPIITDVIKKTPPKVEKSSYSAAVLKTTIKAKLTLESDGKNIELVEFPDVTAAQLLDLITMLNTIRGAK